MKLYIHDQRKHELSITSNRKKEESVREFQEVSKIGCRGRSGGGGSILHKVKHRERTNELFNDVIRIVKRNKEDMILDKTMNLPKLASVHKIKR